jgi:hypothetical protein
MRSPARQSSTSFSEVPREISAHVLLEAVELLFLQLVGGEVFGVSAAGCHQGTVRADRARLATRAARIG